jgi:hypothetical protein
VVGIIGNGRKFLPDFLAARVVVTMHPHHFATSGVLVVELIPSRFPGGLFPSHQWGQGVSDFGSVIRAGVMPAVVATSVFVDSKVVAVARRADIFSILTGL